jgi:hypothetical protein
MFKVVDAAKIAGIVMMLGLIVLGGMTLDPEEARYCEDSGIAMNCEKISQWYSLPNGKCWNEEYGNKLCKTGWEKFSDSTEPLDLAEANNTKIITETVTNTVTVTKEVPLSQIKVRANGGVFICYTGNEGEVTPYTACLKNSGQTGYLGELI